MENQKCSNFLAIHFRCFGHGIGVGLPVYQTGVEDISLF